MSRLIGADGIVYTLSRFRRRLRNRVAEPSRDAVQLLLRAAVVPVVLVASPPALLCGLRVASTDHSGAGIAVRAGRVKTQHEA